MKTENILTIILAIIVLAGFVWSAYSFYGVKESNIVSIQDTTENYNKAVGSELEDKCKTPEGYTDEGWKEHMSHHPDRYVGCFSEEEQKVLIDYTDISSTDLSNMLENKNFVLIDTHIPEQSHIPGTDNFIPYNEIKNRIAAVAPDKGTNIVLYCRSGSMSEQASKELIDMGYSNVFNLKGGLNGWKSEGYDVIDAPLE
jgi:rhodanese-related sulfurtransferase